MSERVEVRGRIIRGAARNVQVLSSKPGRHVVLSQGRVTALCTARSPDGSILVGWRGRVRRVRPVRDEVARTWETRDDPGLSGVVTVPTPAVVARVLVAVGDRVVRGQPVVVVSAMKMETTLLAPHDGVIREVGVVAGSRVRPGDMLVVVSEDR